MFFDPLVLNMKYLSTIMFSYSNQPLLIPANTCVIFKQTLLKFHFRISLSNNACLSIWA